LKSILEKDFGEIALWQDKLSKVICAQFSKIFNIQKNFEKLNVHSTIESEKPN